MPRWHADRLPWKNDRSMVTGTKSTIDLAHTCRGLLHDLQGHELAEPTLRERSRLAFEHDSIEATRHQLAVVSKDASTTENTTVQALFLALHQAVNAFNDHVGPLLHMEDRSQRFAEFKAWMADPIAGENGQHPQT